MNREKAGDHIVVYDGAKRELGEGTLIAVDVHLDMNMTAYICREHTILAKGEHYLRINRGEIQKRALRRPD